MIRRATLTSLLLLFATVRAAEAHSPIEGIGIFYNGLLHPVLVPAHFLSLCAVGLLIGQQAPASSRYSLPALAVAVAVALVAAVLLRPTLPEWALLSLAAIAGISVAFSWSTALAWPLALGPITGAVVGLDSAPDGLSGLQIWFAMSGTTLGAMLLVIYSGGLAAWLDRPWQRIAVRVIGSWIAASAIMVLTLELASRGQS